MHDSARFDPAEFGLPDKVPCPFCDGEETSLHSPFGPQLSVATWWCHRCHTAFDWLKWEKPAQRPAESSRE